ncbi:ABC transporter, periplasmic spermidine putrescine-binding protein PotD (TC 3.A.1.11.1) [Brenneria goodwinii]|uniref:ABC transporter, periplasmic spermidine putrescine-binding protein PotD (TC 3.A.1.11.1) n=2 Tax=Brenneria goodwinii TaxID=1109412 RepID=A0A0G4JNZ7_9GAMM|nr:ABC transporter, periplasmic spermidine putrescine-binding protein PotD (TC 3.A.1.11.1) [Brenneria goodwinii]
MKGIIFGLVLSCVFSSLPAKAAGELRLYNWGDYINPEVLTRFTQETGINVKLDTYGSNEEMLAKIQAGASGYDIVFPSVHMQDAMAALKLLARTDINSPPILNISTRRFYGPKADNSENFFLRKKIKIDKPITSWKDFFAEAEKGKKVIMLDDMRETLGVGLIVNHKSVNTSNPDDLKLASDWLTARKPLISALTYESIPLVQSGDVAAAHYFVGALMYVSQDPENLAYVIPDEGANHVSGKYVRIDQRAE